MGLDMQVIENLYTLVAGKFQPDLTFIFDLDPAIGVKRATAQNRYELMGLPFHQRLRNGFLEIAKKSPGRCVVIDAAQDIQTVHRQVLKTAEDRLLVSFKKAGNHE